MFVNILTTNIPPAAPPMALQFKLNPLPPDADPFLIPVIDRPNHDIPNGRPPGIKQIISGDLGITENIVSPVIRPSVDVLNTPAERTVGNNTSDVSAQYGDNLNNQQKAFINNAIPQNAGLKSFEKSIIKSILETQKPTLELIAILIEMLAILEDAAARFLGSSIRIPVVKTWVGIPSRNPKFTRGALNFDQETNAKNANFIKNINRQALNSTKEAFYLTDQMYGGIPGANLPQPGKGIELKNSYYIGYFNDRGEPVDPPKWVKNSGKWFARDFNLRRNNGTLIQLSDQQQTGVRQIQDSYNLELGQLERERQRLAQEMGSKSSQLENRPSNQKEQADQVFREIETEMRNSVNENAWTEWQTKSMSSQLYQRYSTTPISTARPVTDRKGEPQEPFVTFPTITLTGGKVVEVPLIQTENQVTRYKSGSQKGEIKNLKLETVTSNGQQQRKIIEPVRDYNKTEYYFNRERVSKLASSNRILSSRVPEGVKKYFMPFKYEVVSEYEIRNTVTGQVIRTEQEVEVKQIDWENDYFLRLIRVVNHPISKVGDGTLEDYKDYIADVNARPNSATGTYFAQRNTIPQNYRATGNNAHSAKVINPDSGLMEGEIHHGVDARYLNTQGDNVFWLVEAIKLNDDGSFTINGQKQNQPADSNRESQGKGAKEWYGLLDKFTVIPLLLGKLLPILARKFIPMLIKLVQILTNPRKLTELVDTILQDKLDLHFGQFDTKFQNKAEQDIQQTQAQPDQIGGKAGNTTYIDAEGNVKTVQDGAAGIKIFGIFIGMQSKNGKLEATNSEAEVKEQKEQPLLKFLLNLIKVPFDVIKAIVDFFMQWIKKIVNPFKLIPALIQFFSFQWILKPLSPNSLLESMGINPDQLRNLDAAYLADAGHEERMQKLSDAYKVESSAQYIEVSVYHVLQNGEFVREEYETRELTEAEAQQLLQQNGPNLPGLEDPNVKVPRFSGTAVNIPECGPRNLSLNKIIPLPFLEQSEGYNYCEITQLQTKPLELGLGNLRILEGVLNGLISIPSSFLGLEPHLSLPKLNLSQPVQRMILKLQSS